MLLKLVYSDRIIYGYYLLFQPVLLLTNNASRPAYPNPTNGFRRRETEIKINTLESLVAASHLKNSKHQSQDTSVSFRYSVLERYEQSLGFSSIKKSTILIQP